MQYEKEIVLKNGARCFLRSTNETDAAEVLRTFELTHTETDYLLTYPEENSFTVQQEAELLKARNESKKAIEIAAFIDGRLVGTAGFEPIGDKEKLRHRADFGIAVEKAYWGRGIGKALTLACIECAKQADYLQIELEVVAENASAVRLYEAVGFREYGRNPRGFRARSGWQTLILMRLELDGSVLYSGNGQSATNFTVNIAENGSCAVTVKAQSAKGFVHIQAENQ